MRLHSVLLLLFLFSSRLSAVTFETEDSLRVEELLRQGACLPSDSNVVLFYAHSFEGCPYVPATLEVNDSEQLVVNLRQMDCTTFVETVVALSLTTMHQSRSWTDFLYWLRTIRYRDGISDGYASRNHYFSQRIDNAQRHGLAQEQPADSLDPKFPFTQCRQLDLSYMTSHPSAYRQLRNDSAMRQLIRDVEISSSGKTIHYIPASHLELRQSEMKYVRNGDVLAIVSKKNGLDIAHVGFAEWGRDGKLHLLNASLLHKRVILEPKTLHQYISTQPNQLGIRVVRLIQQ